ncbi:MAG: PKD domain-containing protein, partial [Bacteroidota bacterium]
NADTEADFTYTQTGFTINTINNSTNADGYQWAWPGGGSTALAPSITFPGNGDYDVTLVTANSCGTDEQTVTISINGQAPSVGFSSTNDEGCGPLVVQFNSEVGNASTVLWQFPGGDPATSTLTNPQVVYNTPGNYTATLSATNAFGTNTVTQDMAVIVYGATTASADHSLDATTATFSAEVTHAASLLWTFPDGTTSIMPEPSYTFPGNGTYEVELTVVGFCNTLTLVETVVINGALPSLVIETSEQVGCVPFSVMVAAEGSADTYAWSFPSGEPATASTAEATVTYTQVGSYSATLIATNIFGSTTYELEALVSVNDVPDTPELMSTVVGNGSYEFTVGNPAPGVTYTWDFGDSQASGVGPIGQTYTTSGDYTVTLTATNDCGNVTSELELAVVVVSTNQPAWATRLSIAPNPTSGQLRLLANDWQGSGELDVQLINVLGQRVVYRRLPVPIGQWQHVLDLTDLPAGTYYLNLNWNNSRWVEKVVKL